MAATVHINSLYFSEQRNLRVVSPYLRYYSVFSVLRAGYLMLPEVPWNDGGIISASHSSVIKAVLHHIAAFDVAAAVAIRSDIQMLKAARELVSYRAPSSGDGNIVSIPYPADICEFVAEIAQFNSELLAASVQRNANASAFVLKSEFAEAIAFVKIEGELFIDDEDAWRLSGIARRQMQPYSIWQMMSGGQVDDFFGAWEAKEESDDAFDAYSNKQVIFDIP